MTFFKLLHILIMASLFSQSLMAVSSFAEHESAAVISEQQSAASHGDHHQQDQQCHTHGHCHHLHYAYLPWPSHAIKNTRPALNISYQNHIGSTLTKTLYRPPKA